MRSLRHLIDKWRADAAKWRADDDTPYACEWADTQEECAAELEAALRIAPEDHLDIYVPGTLRCPKCEFQVVSQTLFVQSGAVGMTKAQALVEDVGEPCPNDGTPMVKVRWSERAIEAERAHCKLIDDVIALTGARSLPEALDGLKRMAEAR